MSFRLVLKLNSVTLNDFERRKLIVLTAARNFTKFGRDTPILSASESTGVSLSVSA